MRFSSSLAAPILLAAFSNTAPCQLRRARTPASVTGTYALGSKELPSSSLDGCWLETAPVANDSVRVQVRCTTPPAHHIGAFDARLAFGGDTAVYETRHSGGRCRITMRFAESEVAVTQNGSDQLCGFGAFVNVGGTYARLTSVRPAFDLAPIERPDQPMVIDPKSITIINPKDTAAYSEIGREAMDAVARCHLPACRPDIFRGPGRGELTVGLDSSRGRPELEIHEFQWHILPDTTPPPGGQAYQDSAWAAILTKMEHEKPQRLLLIDGVPRSFAYARAHVSQSSIWGINEVSAKEAKTLSKDPAAANGAIVITTKAHAPRAPT